MERQATSNATVLTLADSLVHRSPLLGILGKPPIRGHLTAALIELDRDYTAEKPDESREDHYAREIAARFGGSAQRLRTPAPR